GPTARATDDGIAVVNPIVLAEVTSASTEDYDPGAKLRHYMEIDSLRQVLIVSHREPRISVHSRTTDGWTVDEFTSGMTMEIRSVAAQVGIDDVYSGGLEDVR